MQQRDGVGWLWLDGKLRLREHAMEASLAQIEHTSMRCKVSSYSTLSTEEACGYQALQLPKICLRSAASDCLHQLRILYTIAMAAGLCSLGVWPVIWNFVERKGRNSAHIYMDYAVTYLVAATTTALTLGQFGSSASAAPNFLEQMTQQNAKLVAFAVLSGICMGVGDASMQYAVALLGLSVAPAIINALIIVIGVSLNYALDTALVLPGPLFAGAGLAAMALLLCAFAHLEHDRSTQEASAEHASAARVPGPFENMALPAAHAELIHTPASPSALNLLASQEVPTQTVELAFSRGDLRRRPLHRANVNTSNNMQPQRSISVSVQHRNAYGLLIAVVGGAIYSLFTPAFNIAVNDPFHMLPGTVPSLSVYCANFYFAIGLFLSSSVFNVSSMQYPMFSSTKSNVWQYIKDNDGRLWCLLAGFLAWLGDLSQFMGGQLVGYSTALLVQAYPLVSVLLGILIFKEFRGCNRKAGVLLGLGICCYAGAICLLMLSARAG